MCFFNVQIFSKMFKYVSQMSKVSKHFEFRTRILTIIEPSQLIVTLDSIVRNSFEHLNFKKMKQFVFSWE